MCCTEAVVSSGRVEKSPHEQEIKFFAKVHRLLLYSRSCGPSVEDPDVALLRFKSLPLRS